MMSPNCGKVLRLNFEILLPETWLLAAKESGRGLASPCNIYRESLMCMKQD